jgi:hypothetical protein
MEDLLDPFIDQWKSPGFMHNELLPLNLNNCIFRKKCEGGGDGEERLRIRYFVKAPTGRRTKDIASCLK